MTEIIYLDLYFYLDLLQERQCLSSFTVNVFPSNRSNPRAITQDKKNYEKAFSLHCGRYLAITAIQGTCTAQRKHNLYLIPHQFIEQLD